MLVHGAILLLIVESPPSLSKYFRIEQVGI